MSKYHTPNESLRFVNSQRQNMHYVMIMLEPLTAACGSKRVKTKVNVNVISCPPFIFDSVLFESSYISLL